MSGDPFFTLAVFGRTQNDAHVKWIDASSRRCSVGFADVDAAWQWRRTYGDCRLLTDTIAEGEYWEDYAAICRADLDSVELDSQHRHVLREYVDADQVAAAIREYTRCRVADGDTMEERARRLLGPALASWMSYTGAEIRRKFETLDRRAERNARIVGGRRWIAMPSDRAYVELLECSRGAKFSRRYLRYTRAAV
jgi:hypothetical protein